MSEDKKPFTVKDRRHFTAEGEARAEDSSRDESSGRSAPAATVDPERPRPAPSPEPVRDAGPRPGLDFAGLLLSLGAQASLLLGIAGEDEEPGPPADLAGAQAVISLLEVLRDKTEGRRTEDEERILQGILYELRMAYVSRARTAGA